LSSAEWDTKGRQWSSSSSSGKRAAEAF
jgi:hypothetical protein